MVVYCFYVYYAFVVFVCIVRGVLVWPEILIGEGVEGCLLYTSDAADE